VDVYAGTAVAVTATFVDPTGAVTDPTTVTFKFKAGAAATISWTYAAGQVTKVSTGVYTATLDTTGLAGNWTVEILGTGACAAVSSVSFAVTTPPL
jgi:hypothetical protein